MALPGATDLVSLKFAFNGQPFCRLVAKAGIDTLDVGYAFQAQPFAYGPEPAVAGITGVLAATEAGDTAALAGSVGVVGALAATEAGDTCAMTGTVVTTESGQTANLFPLLFQWSPEFYEALQAQERERKKKKRAELDALDHVRERKYQARLRRFKAAEALLNMPRTAVRFQQRVA